MKTRHPSKTPLIARVALFSWLPLVLSLGPAPGHAGAPSGQLAGGSVNKAARQLTARVRYVRIQPSTGLQKDTSQRVKELAQSARPPAPRVLSTTRGAKGLVAAKLDPLSVMSFSVLSRTPEGDRLVTCTRLPNLGGNAQAAALKGGRQ